MKKKPAYSLFSNLKFILGNMWKCDKRLTVLTFLRAPFVVCTPYLAIVLSKSVVLAVTGNALPGQVIRSIGLISLASLVSLVAQKVLTAQVSRFMMTHDMFYQLFLFKKLIDCDYENVECPDGLTRMSKALENTGSDDRGARIISDLLSSFLANAIGIVAYAIIIVTLSPWILLVVAATTLSGFFLLKMTSAWTYRNKDSWKGYDRKLAYLRGNAGDFTRAKDIRLYDMTDWFRRIFDRTVADRRSWNKKEQAYYFRADALRAGLSLLRDGLSYGFLIYLVFSRGLSAADFVLYFGVIGGFAAWMGGIIQDCNKLYRCHLGFTELREFVDYPDKTNRGPGEPLPRGTFRIEFKNVSYQYQGSGKKVIDNLSFTVEKGEKLAIVGVNGAGKTTLVKLMCGLYRPTEGEILIDGKPVDAYNIIDYYSMFSVVFQDITVLPMSVARNVAACTDDKIDRRRVDEALRLAGLACKVAALPNGADTLMQRSIYDDAVDFSGGEMQKLALARALYKGGKALILDEPTAALDPIAESEIYNQYNAMSAGHTSVFISHRLASTRFCDRIFLLEHGRVAESGSHDELMRLGGKYCQMFEVQSHYYKAEVADEQIAAG